MNLKNSIGLAGAQINEYITYVGATIAGTDNTSMGLITKLLPAKTLTKLGDRVRFRVYFSATAGSNISGNLTLNGIAVSETIINGTNIRVAEVWIHYRDATHANILESGATPEVGAMSAINVAGFDWENDQDVTFHQTQVFTQHLALHCLFVDTHPIATV